VVHLGKHFNTHSVHLFEPESVQAFLATVVIRSNVIVTADIEVKTLQLRNRICLFAYLRLTENKVIFYDRLTNIVQIVVPMVKSAMVKLSPAANSLPLRKALSTSNDFSTRARSASLTEFYPSYQQIISKKRENASTIISC